jgi:hypothetical protein
MSTAAKLVRRPGLKAQPAAGLNRDRYRALWLRRRPAHGYARDARGCDGGVQEELGTAVGLTPPACGLLVRQGGAIAALEACRGTAQMHRGPHQLAARIAPPARGTIAPRRLAWAGTPFLGRETDRRRKRSRRLRARPSFATSTRASWGVTTGATKIRNAPSPALCPKSPTNRTCRGHRRTARNDPHRTFNSALNSLMW